LLSQSCHPLKKSYQNEKTTQEDDKKKGIILYRQTAIYTTTIKKQIAKMKIFSCFKFVSNVSVMTAVKSSEIEFQRKFRIDVM
jgi:CxxC motif-containing protein